MSRLRDFYTQTAVPQLKEKLQVSNVMQVPRITKITLNMGVGEAIADRKIVDKAMGDLEYFQAARWNAYRMQGHAAKGTDV